MAKDDLIASIFSSAVKTSLSAQKAAPKKKVVGKNESQAAHVSAKPKQVTGIAAPTENQDWVGVTNKKANKSKNTALVASAPVAISKTGATSKDALTSNAFYLPKSLEKHLHKAVTTNLEVPKLSVTKNTAVPSQFTKGQPQLTKSQRKNQLRAQKRAKKRKLQDLNQKLQDLTFGANIEAPKVIVIEQVDTRSVDTSTTVVSSEAGAPHNAGDCMLLSLPYEVLTNGILSYLRPEEMGALGACNKETKEVSEAGFLWQTLFRQRFTSSLLNPMAMKEWKLAYQLSLTKIVDRLRCGTTKKTFLEDVLGVGVNFTSNPKTGAVDYVALAQDLISETAFVKHKVRQDVFGNSFKLFLPLFFSAEHFKRALPQIEKTVAHLALNFRHGNKKLQRFHPHMVLDVIPKIITTFVVPLSDNGISACEKSYQGLIRIHRLFLALAQQYPDIEKEALRRLKLFVSDEKYRTKAACPNLGAVVPLLMIVDDKVFNWPQMCLPYMRETFDRCVLWACKKFPSLERTHDATGKVESVTQAESRVELTLQASQVTLRLVMFHVYFLKALCRGTIQARANRYDCFFGQPEPTVSGGSDENDAAAVAKGVDSTIRFTHFREQINCIMNVSTWQKFLAFVGLPCPPSKAEMARRLRCHVINSRRKKYHTAGMNFSRIQASCTSKILSKGQEYGASKGLRRVVFKDDWKFDGGIKYLDATCLLFHGKTLLETIDYSHRTDSRGAVWHSGDVTTASTGSHTIRMDLGALHPRVTSCVFVLSAWADATLDDIKSPRVSFANAEGNDGDPPLCTYDLDAHDKVSYLTAIIMRKMYRVSGGWHVQAIGDAHKGAADNYGPIYEAVRKLL